jgi:hypothetical protein
MHATLEAVLARTILADDLSIEDQALARRLAREFARYGVGALPDELFDGPSGRKLARLACEDVEGVRRNFDLIAGHPTGCRTLEMSEGWGMVSLVLGHLFRERQFHVVDNDPRRRWLWQRMALSAGLRNLQWLPIHPRISPGDWDLVLVKDTSPTRALDLAASLLAAGGDLLLWANRRDAKGLRRRRLDARSRPLRLSAATALTSPVAVDRLVACLHSAAEPDSAPSAESADEPGPKLDADGPEA